MKKGYNYIFFLVFAGIMTVMLSMGQSSINNAPNRTISNRPVKVIEEKMPRIKTIKNIKPVITLFLMIEK